MNAPRVLVAGVGNVFFGDDGFGVEVARRLLMRPWPPTVTIRDFGIRGMDFAYALLAGYDAAILVDTVKRGREPGTLYVLEPEEGPEPEGAPFPLDTHAMDPARVLRFVRAMGGEPGPLHVVGCEPATFGQDDDEPTMGLSPHVEQAVAPAIVIIEALIARGAGATGRLAGALHA
jgi:hydrogenase maturation protease